jgi:hypothetical protein
MVEPQPACCAPLERLGIEHGFVSIPSPFRPRREPCEWCAVKHRARERISPGT